MSGTYQPQRSAQRTDSSGSSHYPAPAQRSNDGPAASSSDSTPAISNGMRTASGSSRRKDSSQQPLSQIEKSVTHLLIATKQLLETLTKWSRHEATENEVSDVYVRLGYEFNIACRAFAGIGVDTADLGPVPDLLRTILEDTLSQEASPTSLDKYLPRIRDIIINLLQGLKKKQQKSRVKQSDINGASVENGPGPQSGTLATQGSIHRRTSSNKQTAQAIASTYTKELDNSGPNNAVRQPGALLDSGKQLPSSVIQEAPLVNEPDPASSENALSTSNGTKNNNTLLRPPKQSDALAALQRGGDLERRASRRFSAYQIQKVLGSANITVPIPQNTPVPNRGQIGRDNVNAMRSRNAGPSTQAADQNRSSTHITPAPETPSLPPDMNGRSDIVLSSNTATFEKENRQGIQHTIARRKTPSPSRAIAPIDNTPVASLAKEGPLQVVDIVPGSNAVALTESQTQGGQTNEPLTLFLQYRSKVKRHTLPTGTSGLSLAKLQLAFIEKFSWNTYNNGVDLPEIYIQDPASGVRYELEELSDIKQNSVLVLNVEVLDEVKRHFDTSFGDLQTKVEALNTSFKDQQDLIHQVSQRQQSTSVELTRLAATPPVVQQRAPLPTASRGFNQSNTEDMRGFPDQLAEIRSLRHDLAVARQTLNTFQDSMASSMQKVRETAGSISTKAIEIVAPPLSIDQGRAHVEQGKKKVEEKCENIVNTVDDLADIVEDLRKDVLTRGVRPLPRQIDDTSRDISNALVELKKMQELVRTEKPHWTKVWERELELVCSDREFLSLQENLMADCDDDLNNMMDTIALVEEATKQQNAQIERGVTSTRMNLRGLPLLASDITPSEAKEGYLGEVRALQPNHEGRLEAIERAEKARQRELEIRREGPFKKELGEFVEQGRLKRAGGHEEIDRLRQAQDEKNIKAEWEAQQARKLARAKEREEEKRRKEAEKATESRQEDARNEFDEDNFAEAQEHPSETGDEEARTAGP